MQKQLGSLGTAALRYRALGQKIHLLNPTYDRLEKYMIKCSYMHCHYHSFTSLIKYDSKAA